MLGRIHISVIFVHPLGGIEVGHVLLQIVHNFCDVVLLGLHWHRLFFVEMILYLTASLLGPNFDRLSFLISSSPSPRR
jgi:hypothetical protein